MMLVGPELKFKDPLMHQNHANSMIHNGDASRSGPLSGSVGGENHHGMIRRDSFVIDAPGASACF